MSASEARVDARIAAQRNDASSEAGASQRAATDESHRIGTSLGDSFGFADPYIRNLREAVRYDGGAVPQLGPVAPPQAPLTDELHVGADSFAASLKAAADSFLERLSAGESLGRGTPTPSWEAGLSTSGSTPMPPVGSLSTSSTTPAGWQVPSIDVQALQGSLQLTGAFLKLTVADTSNTAATHFALHEIASNLREMAIRESQKKLALAHELAKEAEIEAERLGEMASVTNLLMLGLGVLTMATGGALAPVTAAVGLATNVGFAAENLRITNLMINARQVENDARVSDARADEMQAQIEEQATTIREIMENSNYAIDAVIRMLNAHYATQAVVMASGMTR